MTWSRERFAELVRSPDCDVAEACLLIGCEVERDLTITDWLVELDVLAARVTSKDVGGLQRALSHFSGGPADYADLRSSLLHQVLRRHRGLPILLSVVWTEVARRVGLEAVSLGLPGHVLTLVGETVVDPFSGGTVVHAPHQPALDPGALLLRVLANVRALAERQGMSLDTARTRLWATELSLLLPRHPVELRREQGELLLRLGEFRTGATALEEYAELVESHSAEQAESARRQARLGRARLN
ncbi:MAG: Protein sirB1 [Frankiales bacterium]|nr:Protein sirB1 [Frankiales bacterium]